MDKAHFYRQAATGLTGPLDGVRVLDITTAWAGPMTSCLLADLGCDVVRVEQPGGKALDWLPAIPGTELSWAHETVNRNKRAVTLDLRHPEGARLLLGLVRTADIVVENFKPGTLAGWGVGYEQCREVRPDVVYVSVSGYGQFGPWADRPGYDPAILAASGWMSLNGAVDGGPNKAPTFIADDVTALHAALAALAALHHRRRTGEGQHVDVCLFDAMTYQSNGMLTLGATGVPLTRWGNQLAGFVPCNAYRCADGGHVYIAIALDSHWRRFVQVAGRPELADDPDYATNAARTARREEADAVVADWCAHRSVEEVLDVCMPLGIVLAPVNTFHQSAQEPHVWDREMLVPTQLSDGTEAPITGPAAKFSRTPTTVRSGAAPVGAHTDEILAEVGVDAETRDKLRAEGVI